MDEFQVLVKIAGGRCNLRCPYCYYLPRGNADRMPSDILEIYIRRHIEASRDQVIGFSWHGGEPTLYGLDGFREIVSLQKKYCPPGRRVLNGIQTNGTLIDDAWTRFLAEEQFIVGLSLDGPQSYHDCNRRTSAGEPTHSRVLESYARLKEHGVTTECLCVVHAGNARQPLELYEFFRELGVSFLTFLPLVERLPDGSAGERSVSGEDWGEFLCAIFDAWQERDIGEIKIQLFEEAARVAFGLGHSLCVLRETCGGVPVLDCNGDLYSCDHFMQPEHRLGNIKETSLARMLADPRQRNFGMDKRRTLPGQCLSCPVLDMCGGGCPKDRILTCADGEPGLNFLCVGFKRFFLHCRPFVEMLATLNANRCIY